MSNRVRRPELVLQKDLVQDNLPTLVVPGLYLGSIHSAFNCDALKEHNISYIVNASGLAPTFPKSFTYLNVEISDKENANILSVIPLTSLFIATGIEHGGTFVHCHAGRSRSPSMVIAYLMTYSRMSYDEAYAQVRSVRPLVTINRGFQRQLRAYWIAGCDVYKAHQLLLQKRIQSVAVIRELCTRYGKTVNALADDGILPESLIQLANPSYQSKAKKSQNQALSRSQVSASNNKTLDDVDDDDKLDDADDDDDEDLAEEEDDEDAGPSSSQMSVVVGAAHGDGTYIATSKCPNIRLVRPKSATIRVIPPLRGLDRTFDCYNCASKLFTLANVIRPDLCISQTQIDMTTPRPVEDESLYQSGSSLSARNRSMFGSNGSKPAVKISTVMQEDDDDDAIPTHKAVNAHAHSFNFGSAMPVVDNSVDSRPYLQSSGSLLDGDNGCDDDDDDDDFAVVDLTKDYMFKNEIICADPKLTIALTSARGTSNTIQQQEKPLSSRRMEIQQPPPPISARSSEISKESEPSSNMSTPSSSRCGSAEKRRWLSRLALLHGTSDSGNDDNHHSVSKLADADEEALMLSHRNGQFVSVEYLWWMGENVITQESGPVLCPYCHKELGSWVWDYLNPTVPLSSRAQGSPAQTPDPGSSSVRRGSDAKLAPKVPIIYLDKSLVNESQISFDQTPTATPRRNSLVVDD